MSNKTKVLVIDDDVNICELIRLYMEKEGFEVVTVYNGSKALEVFRNEAPNIVILDIMLPGKKNQQYSGDYAFGQRECWVWSLVRMITL